MAPNDFKGLERSSTKNITLGGIYLHENMHGYRIITGFYEHGITGAGKPYVFYKSDMSNIFWQGCTVQHFLRKCPYICPIFIKEIIDVEVANFFKTYKP